MNNDQVTLDSLEDGTFTAKKVYEYLEEVDYSEIENYVPSSFALEFVNFIKLVEGGSPENKTPTLHYMMIDNFIGDEDNYLDDVINMCHRGIAKSTLKEYLILYLGVYGGLPYIGKIPYGIYVSDSMDNGVAKMRKSLEYRYNNSEFLRKYIPTIRFTENRWEFINLEGRSTVFSAYGAKTGVRGTRENNTRPILALLDDLVSDKDASSPTIISTIEDTVYNAIEHALHPTKRKVIWSGTPFNERDPLYKAVESGAYRVNVFPVCEKFPCSREEFKGSWPERFTYDAILKAYTKAKLNGKLNGFYQELMLSIMSDEDKILEEDDIKWYSRDTLVQRKSTYNFYITTDFATVAEESGDFSFISVWAYNALGQWFWVDGMCERQLMDKNIDALFRFCQQYRPESVGVEVTGQQGGFISWIQELMLQRNIHFHLACNPGSKKPGIRPTANKFARFRTIEHWFKAGNMFFPTEMKGHPAVVEIIKELSYITVDGFKSKYDDGIDTVTMLQYLDAWKPSDNGGNDLQKNSNDVWEHEKEEESSNIDSYIV